MYLFKYILHINIEQILFDILLIAIERDFFAISF